MWLAIDAVGMLHFLLATFPAFTNRLPFTSLRLSFVRWLRGIRLALGLGLRLSLCLDFRIGTGGRGCIASRLRWSSLHSGEIGLSKIKKTSSLPESVTSLFPWARRVGLLLRCQLGRFAIRLSTFTSADRTSSASAATAATAAATALAATRRLAAICISSALAMVLFAVVALAADRADSAGPLVVCSAFSSSHHISQAFFGHISLKWSLC